VRTWTAGLGWVALGLFAADLAWTLPWRAAWGAAWVPIRWLTNPDLSLASIILATLVRGPGGALIIYRAALDGIPKDLYEAARIDGAGPVQQWWHVTVPLLAPTTLFLVMTLTIDSFQVFAQVLMLTDGGPGISSTVLVHKIYTAAFRDLDFGGASAMAMVLFAMIAGVSVIQYRLFGRGTLE
jgi:multiple sugar transport system permease protein